MLHFRLLLVTLAIFSGLSSWASKEALPGVFTLDCPAAGIPSGWRVDNEVCRWEADPDEAGVACLTFDKGGRVRLVSPVFLVTPGDSCGFSVRARADNDRAVLKGDIADTYRDDDRLLRYESPIAAEWAEYAKSSPVTPEKCNPQFFTLEISAPEGAKVHLGFIQVQPCVDAPAKRYPCGITLKPVAPWGVYTANEKPAVRITAAGAQLKGMSCHLILANTSVIISDLTKPIKIDAAPLWTTEFATFQGMTAFGLYRVSAHLAGPNGEQASQEVETLIARVPEPAPGPRPDSWFGAHVALREPDLSAASKLGYKWCRIHDASGITKWGILESEPGVWNWQDDQIALARKHGFTIMGMLDSAPPWETGADPNGYFGIYHAPKDIAKWRNYVRSAVSHYKGAIDTWEVWNEPWDMARFFNGGTPGKYVELLKSAYEEAKSANPDCRIIGVDTYPAFWEAMVLANGAAGYYDALSWHRYDPNMHGAPNDSIARVAKRLAAVQSPYMAKPKPLVCTEGGPDVSVFHGSFFSFAPESVVGDWSRGADVYPRMFLSMIAAGNERFIAYSLHNETRVGQQTHMMTEPGYLLKPMQVSLAALAHFVEGARYVGRKTPAQDVTALVFERAAVPSQVVVVYSDGEEPVPLNLTLPEETQYYDRWGNPCMPPTEAVRSPVYCVAERVNLAAAFEPEAPVSPGAATSAALVDRLASVLNRANDAPPIWSLFSPAAGLISISDARGQCNRVNRNTLEPEIVLTRIPVSASAEVRDLSVQSAGRFSFGTAEIGGIHAFFGLSKEGAPVQYRFTWLTLMTEPQPTTDIEEVIAPLRHWEEALKNKSVAALYETITQGPACVTANTLNGEYFHFDRPEYLIGMMNTAVVWGVAPVSKIIIRNVHVSGGIAVVEARWDIASMPLGMAPFTLSGTLEREHEGWKITAMTFGPMCAD